MAVDRGFLVILEARADRVDDLAALLRSAQVLATAEEGTVSWYAFRLSETTFGIFDTFADEDARQTHARGHIPAALTRVGPDLLTADPDIRPVDVLASLY